MNLSTTRSPVTKKEIWAWCLYDFSNSAYTTIIVTVAYSVYFTEVVAKGQNPEAWWGRAYALSMLISGLLSPILGALADYSARRKFYLTVLTLLAIVPTALLVSVGPGDVLLGIGLFVVANVCYNSALTFYDSFLKDLSSPSNIGRISGYGWSLGYIGGLCSLLLAYPLIQGGFSPENQFAYRLSFPLTAAFYLLFSIPILLFLKERSVASFPRGQDAYWRVGLRRVSRTLGEIKRFKELLKFFIAFLIYGDGIHTIIVFAAIFAVKVLQFTPQDLMIYFIVMQTSSALGAYLFGWVTDRVGPKRTVLITLVIWIGVVGWAYGVQTKGEFYMIGLVAGLSLGSCQSASRSLLGLFTPASRSAEFFGFFALTGKLAAIMGPLFFGEIVRMTGDHRLAILSIGIFFVIGLICLLRVDEKAGIAAAREN